jgi:pimeloyl-ACP methyl ester carboxylesterase
MEKLLLLFIYPLTLALATSESGLRPGIFQYSPSVKVAYDVHGAGPLPVVLLHSLGSAKESWDPVTPGLLAVCKCRIYRVDLKGHGDTSAPDDHRYSLRENADIIRAFMADQKLRGAVLMGHSYGGAVALTVALDAKNQDPGLLYGLILIGTPGVFQKFPFVVTNQRYEAYGKIVDHLTTPKARAWIAVHAVTYGRSQGIEKRIQLYERLWSDPARSRAARETARQFLDGGDLKALASRDHDTGIPTLLIAGRHDNLVGVKYSRELTLSIPGAKLAVIPNTGHAPQEEGPELVLPLISDFLHSVFMKHRLPR